MWEQQGSRNKSLVGLFPQGESSPSPDGSVQTSACVYSVSGTKTICMRRYCRKSCMCLNEKSEIEDTDSVPALKELQTLQSHIRNTEQQKPKAAEGPCDWWKKTKVKYVCNAKGADTSEGMGQP